MVGRTSRSKTEQQTKRNQFNFFFQESNIDGELTFDQLKQLGAVHMKPKLPKAVKQCIDNCVCTFAVTGKKKKLQPKKRMVFFLY